MVTLVFAPSGMSSFDPVILVDVLTNLGFNAAAGTALEAFVDVWRVEWEAIAAHLRDVAGLSPADRFSVRKDLMKPASAGTSEPVSVTHSREFASTTRLTLEGLFFLYPFHRSCEKFGGLT